MNTNITHALQVAIDTWTEVVPDLANVNVSLEITTKVKTADALFDQVKTDIPNVIAPGDIHIRVNPIYADDTRMMLHELGHGLGISYAPGAKLSTFENYLWADESGIYFTGPNAVRINKGLVPVSNDGYFSHLTGHDLMSDISDSGVDNKITKLDIAIVEDVRIYSKNEALIVLLYDKLLHRAPDHDGKEYWLNQLNHGMNKYEIAHAVVDGAQEKVDITGLLDFI